MNNYKAIIYIFLASMFFLNTALAQNDPQAEAVIKNFENKLNLEGFDVSTDFTLVQKIEGEADRVLKINIYRRDASELFTIIFEYPDSEKGKGYLRQGDDLFLYLPTTREFVYRNRKDDIGSTDVRTDIFGKLTNLEKFKATYLGSEKVSEWDCHVIYLEAISLDVSFALQKWYVRKSDGLPVKVENFSLSGTLLRTYYYISYKQVGSNKYIFTKFLAVNHLEQGQKTFITIQNVRTTPINDYTFTKAFLEEQSR